MNHGASIGSAGFVAGWAAPPGDAVAPGGGPGRGSGWLRAVPLRVVLDATPLLGPRTGVGRYVEQLVRELARRDGLELVATAFTLRGAGALPAAVPPAVQVRHRPAPARALQA